MSNQASFEVYQMLKHAGGDLTLVQSTPGAGGYDPTTGTLPAPTITNYTFRGIVSHYLDTDATNSLIINNMRKILIPSNLGTAPKMGDKVTQGSTSYTITQVDAVYFYGQVAMYACKAQA